MITLLFYGRSFFLRLGEESLRELDEFENFSENSEDYQMMMQNDFVYEYNENLINLLILGIDGRGTAERNTNYGFGPRADSIYLAVIDPEDQKMQLVSVSRDIITQVKLFDSLGQDMGTYPMQLGLQFSNGDGLEGSCELMESAVSNLFGGIPIHGYCALYWNGIFELQEMLGSVTVYVPEYLHKLDPINFEKSGMTQLNAEQAKIYVQCRDISVTGSDELRRERQMTYMEAIYALARWRVVKNPFYALYIKEELDPYLVTNLETSEILSLANWIVNWNMQELLIDAIPGKTISGELQDEYVIDEKEFQQLIGTLFYKE